MFSLKPEDAKILNRVANAEKDGLKNAIDNYANETHSIGFIEGMLFLGVDIIGVVATYKLACMASDGFCKFGEKAIGEFLQKN